MPGPIPLLAEVAPVSWHDVATFATPVLVLAVLAWVVMRTDRIVETVFPDLEWERSLGWLNIRAERRASLAMRWVRLGVIVMLVDALVILYWCAKGLPDLSTWADPWVMGDLALRVPLMAVCLLIWVIYLGLGLLPRVRADREVAAYRKFRAQLAATDEEKGELEAMGQKSSRGPTELPKPRANTKSTTLTPRRHWRQHPPGG
jgi:hypothetical protein